MQSSLTHWRKLVFTSIPLLNELPESALNEKPAPDKWSKKEILGHLIDSATNNHHRWVRAQFEPSPTIRYDQNLWVQNACHASMQSSILIQTWQSYNHYLLAFVPLIPEEKLLCQVYQSDTPWSLEASIIDYVKHLQHHLQQILPQIG